MNVIVDLCVVFLGVGVFVGQYVVVCQKVLVEVGLKYIMYVYGINIEGDWDEVFVVVKVCYEVVYVLGVFCIIFSMCFGICIDCF